MGFVFLLRLVIIITSNVSVFSMNFFLWILQDSLDNTWIIRDSFRLFNDSQDSVDSM